MTLHLHEETRDDSSVSPIFTLADLAKIYRSHLEDLGLTVESRIHSTRLKGRILAYFPDMIACHRGKDVTHAFDRDISDALHKVQKGDYDSEDIWQKQQVLCEENSLKLIHSLKEIQ